MVCLCTNPCLLGPNLLLEDEAALQLKHSKSIETRSGKESPFATLPDQHQEHEWPDMYVEIDEMMESCMIIEPLSRLKSFAAALNKDQRSNQTLTLPRATHIEIISWLAKRNDATLRNARSGLQYRFRVSPTRVLSIETGLGDIVSSVAINHRWKRVTLCFEGSADLLDSFLSCPSFMRSCPNPARKFDSTQPEHVYLHNVLQSCLFDPNDRGLRGPTGEVLSQYQETLYNQVVPILREHPSYKLYVTGHGLGGALATVFGFFAASEPSTLVPKPVSIVSFGSPYVGDLTFRSAHQNLERLGKLRHLRVSNHQDMVTLTPQATPLGAQRFKHVGVNVRLYEGLFPAELWYPRVGVGLLWEALDELSRGWDQSVLTNLALNADSVLGHHNLLSYYDRLKRNEREFRQTFLNEIYVCREIVGDYFVAHNSIPK